MKQDVPVSIPGGEQVGGDHPLVVIGPNGSGKTRFGVQLATANEESELISAMRNIQIQPQIGMRALTQATSELAVNLRQARANCWEMSNELDVLLSKLLAQDSEAGRAYRNTIWKGGSDEIVETSLMILERIWSELLPGRVLDMGYTPTIRARHLGCEDEYPAKKMSDGERGALYLAARVIDSSKKLIIVDEPEVHFHNRLAVRFWNTLESLRDDCRFVYITHDLPFALSRQSAQFIIIQPQRGVNVLPVGTHLPSDLANALLSAASLSVYANRIVFCEGVEKDYSDFSFYSAWFNDTSTEVVPVGGFKDVAKCVDSFNETDLISGVSCIGIVDRDYWPNQCLHALRQEVRVLPFHELESLLSLKGVFLALASKLRLVADDANRRYAESLDRARRSFSEGLLCKQISERFKKRLEVEILPVLNSFKMTDTVDGLEVMHTKAVRELHARVDPALIFSEEKQMVLSALSGGDDEFLKVLPGKGTLGNLCQSLGITRERYVELLEATLREDPLKDEASTLLDQALKEYLPVRRQQGQ